MEPARAELLVALLAEGGTLGIEERGPGRLRAFFHEEPRAELFGELRRLGARRRRVEVRDRDWVSRAQARQKPVRVGPLWIGSPWDSGSAPPRGLNLVIDPARAFGTGSHESTRLLLGALVESPPRGLAVLDVGAGTGILALAALRLGAAFAVAVDVDRDAAEATRLGAERNGLGTRVAVVQGGLEAIGRRFPLVLANLTAPLLCGLAGELRGHLEPGGRLLVAGLLAHEAPGVRAALGSDGLAWRCETREGEWVGTCFQKREGPPLP